MTKEQLDVLMYDYVNLMAEETLAMQKVRETRVEMAAVDAKARALEGRVKECSARVDTAYTKMQEGIAEYNSLRIHHMDKKDLPTIRIEE